MNTIRRKQIVSILLLLIALTEGIAQDLSNIKDVKPFTANGTIGLNTSFYNISNGMPERQSPFVFGLNATATFSLYGINMPFSFTWYSNEKAGFQQPFNQFGISPEYKWLTVHLGYRNMSFSEFTLNGHTFLGAGVEATPGKFRLGAVYGKFNENSSNDLVYADSIPKLTRTGWAFKAGYGTVDKFVDLSILRIGDNPNNFVDSMAKLDFPTPAQNIALGLTSKYRISPKLFFNFDGSLSFFTNNIKMGGSDSTNNNMLRFAQNFITVNGTSEYYKAIKTGISYKFNSSFISGIEYRLIDPGYQSMGSYFFNNDIEMLTLNQSAGFLKNKLTTRGSLGFQHDNLNKIKKNTSNRIIGSLTANYAITPKLGIDLSFSNYSTSQKAIKKALSDTLLVFQVNSNLSITPHFIATTETMSHVVMLNINFMKLEDKNKNTQFQTNTDTKIAMLMYSFGLLKSKLNISTGINYTDMSNSNFNNQLSGVTLGVSKTFLKDKLSINWNNAFMINELNGEKGKLFNMALIAGYSFLPKHSVSFNFNMIQNSFSNSSTVPSFNEIKGEIGYAYTF